MSQTSSRAGVVAVACFALGLVVGMLLAETSDRPTSTEEQLRRLRDEKKLLRELTELQREQLDDINAVLEEPIGERDGDVP